MTPGEDGQKAAQDNFQDILKLRIDYLKRSPLYKQLCEYIRNNKGKDFRFEGLPVERRDNHSLLANYMTFGDIHAESFSFEAAYSAFQGWTEIFQTLAPFPVADYSTLISSDFDRCAARLTVALGREPTLAEFKVFFVDFIKHTGHSYLRVDCSDHNMKTLKNSFAKAVRNYRRSPSNAQFLSPTTLGRLGEINYYLHVYDLKQKLTYREIIQHEQPGRNGDPQDIEREFKRYVHKAKKIISNVENGISPGKY
jgi:hypothetical protein